MIVVCPQCHKKLNAADRLAGKNVRCPECKAVVAVPASRTGDTAETAAETAPAEQEQVSESLPSAMRCAACKVATVQPLPANRFSRHPGYVCKSCRKVMRPPGTAAPYVLVAVVGAFATILAFAFVIILLSGDGLRVGSLAGAFALGALGVSGSGWALFQLRKPAPLNAPKGASRLWLWIVIIVIGLAFAGGGIFGLMYVFQEMM
jgi:hypothetical protein